MFAIETLEKICRCICLERVTQREATKAGFVHQLNGSPPQQALPKIYKIGLQKVWTTCLLRMAPK
jgi:hypothetical protein